MYQLIIYLFYEPNWYHDHQYFYLLYLEFMKKELCIILLLFRRWCVTVVVIILSQNASLGKKSAKSKNRYIKQTKKTAYNHVFSDHWTITIINCSFKFPTYLQNCLQYILSHCLHPSVFVHFLFLERRIVASNANAKSVKYGLWKAIFFCKVNFNQ